MPVPRRNPVAQTASYDEDEEESVAAAPARRRAPAAKAAPRAEEYEDEDEDEVPARGSIVQAGWGAAQKLKDESYGINEVKISEEETIVKFLQEDPFAVYKQHFLEKREQGKKKSFVCLEQGCPLCDDLQSRIDRKFAFNVLVVDGAETRHQSLTVGPRVIGTLQKIHEGRQGPITKGYVSLSKVGKGLNTQYTVQAVSTSSAVEDYGVDDAAVAKAAKAVQMLTADSIVVISRKELREVVEELA